MITEQDRQRRSRYLVVGDLLLEGGRLVQCSSDDEADNHDDNAEQERDPPPPGQQLLLGQHGRQRQEHGIGHN